MVVPGGWAFSYERGAHVGYGPEGPLLQEELGHLGYGPEEPLLQAEAGHCLSRWSSSGYEAVLVEDQAWLKLRRARSP